MGTIFINSENNKNSEPERIIVTVSDIIDLKKSDKYFALSNLIIGYREKNVRMFYKNNMALAQHGVKNLIYLTDHILYHTFKIILNSLSKCMKNLLIILQYKCILTKLKTGLYLKPRLDIVLNFQYLKQGKYLEVPKIRWLKIKMVKMHLI